ELGNAIDSPRRRERDLQRAHAAVSQSPSDRSETLHAARAQYCDHSARQQPFERIAHVVSNDAIAPSTPTASSRHNAAATASTHPGRAVTLAPQSSSSPRTRAASRRNVSAATGPALGSGSTADQCALNRGKSTS